MPLPLLAIVYTYIKLRIHTLQTTVHKSIKTPEVEHTGIPNVPCFSDANPVRRISLFVGEGEVPFGSDLIVTSLSVGG